MNELDSVPGQLFRIIADAASSRGGARSDGAPSGGSPETSAFRQLLRTVSQQSKSASMESGAPESAGPGASRFKMPRSPVLHDRQDETRHSERSTANDGQEPTAGPLQQPDTQHSLPHLPLNGADPAVSSMVGVEMQASRGNPASATGQVAATSTSRRRGPSGPTNGADPAVAPMVGSEVQAFRGTAAPATGQAAATTGHHNMLYGAASRMGEPEPLPEAGALATPRSISAGSSLEAITANLQSGSRLSSRDASAPHISNVSVIQQETHFPPVAQQTAPQQVADAVVEELTRSSAVTAPDPASPSSSGPDQPLKVLTIQLDPPSLGSVTVRFRLMGDAVTIHLAADRRDTTQLLEEQRGSIRELMRSAGYIADVASVQHGSLDGLPSGSAHPQSTFGGQPQQQSQASSDTFNPSSGDAQNGARQPRQEREQNQEARHEQDMVSHNRRGALFI